MLNIIKQLSIPIIAILIIAISTPSLAHPGGLDKNGGGTTTEKTGDTIITQSEARVAAHRQRIDVAVTSRQRPHRIQAVHTA